MKISKLFHWLYACLMLLPIVAILTSCLMLIFNEGASTMLDTTNYYDVFYNAVDNVRDSVLFSWCNTSFLSTPITYISNLFGMPQNSPIITFLSYWLNISIIWLVFDVIMYIPLLTHRWLDKGIRD